jgi:hypothetical protein
MNPTKIKPRARRLAVLAVLPLAACAITGEPPVSPLIGTWGNPENSRVTFAPNAVVIQPEKGAATTMGPAECNGRFKLVYGRMQTAPLKQAFASQADLQAKLKQMLLKPEYPVADVMCDQGGTTYVLLDDRQVLAVYRDAGVGGIERLSRL